MHEILRYLITFEPSRRSKAADEIARRHREMSEDVCDELEALERTLTNVSARKLNGSNPNGTS